MTRNESMRESEMRFCVFDFEEVKSRPYSIPVGIAALKEGEEQGSLLQRRFLCGGRGEGFPLSPEPPHPLLR